MAKNVLQKHWNGTSWDEIHPITKAANVILADTSSVEEHLTKKVPAVFNVKGYGAVGDGVTNDTTEISIAITAAAIDGGIVFFPSGGYITSSFTVPLNVTLSFSIGAYLGIASGEMVTINGAITAEPTSIFTGLGSVDLANSLVTAVYPEWWGAKGDESNDDTAAIQKAVDSERSVILRGVTYKITTPILLNNNTKISGAGRWNTFIKCFTSNQIGLNVTGLAVKISDLSIVYSTTPTSLAKAILVSEQACSIEDVYILNCYIGIHVTGTSGAFIKNVNIDDYVSIAVQFDDCNDIILDKFIFNAGNTTRGALGGIRIQDHAEAIMISNGDILNGVFSITTDAANNTIGQRTAYSKFTNVYFDSSLNGAGFNKMVAIRFVSCWFSNRPGNGCSIDNAEDVTFTTCDFINNGAYGCSVTNTCKRIKFVGCSFISNNSEDVGAHGLSIAANTTDFVVQGCTFTNGLGFTGLQNWGVIVNSGTSDRYIIADNLVTGNAAGGVTDGGTGTNKRVENNY